MWSTLLLAHLRMALSPACWIGLYNTMALLILGFHQLNFILMQLSGLACNATGLR